MSIESFSLRRDRNGLRPVYNLGNEGGACPNGCKFCNVGRSPKVSAENNLREFDKQHESFLRLIDGPYHPLIYNQGNVTNKREFSRVTLEHVLNAFQGDSRVVFLSLNSRQRYVTSKFLEFIFRSNLSYPIHFILGVESFSPRANDLFGKNTSGELERFIEIIRPVNQQSHRHPGVDYKLGLDVNIVFLPEMYLSNGMKRADNKTIISDGIRWELRQLLKRIDPFVPVEINLHPFYRVKNLPYEDMGLELLIEEIPALQAMVAEHNKTNSGRDTHLFVGVEGNGYEHSFYKKQLIEWKRAIKNFNFTGVLSIIR